MILAVTGIVVSFCGGHSKPQTDENRVPQTMEPVAGGPAADHRISLNLTARQKNHQLNMMRSQVAAIRAILEFISQENYADASKIAHEKRGLTTEMKALCTSFGNQRFAGLGLEFHRSADRLGAVLKTRNMHKSLAAVATTMQYCVQCHLLFKS